MYIVYMAGRPPRQKPKMTPANNYARNPHSNVNGRRPRSDPGCQGVLLSDFIFKIKLNVLSILLSLSLQYIQWLLYQLDRVTF